MTTTLKHQWSVKYQFLMGITASDWWEILRENRLAVEPRYLHRAGVITLMSLINSFYRGREERRYGAEIAAAQIRRPPLFVLGHWRSGTTYLHHLLVQDQAQFAYPTVYQAGFPHTFLSTEALFPRLVARYAPHNRLIDNVPFHFDLPQEDEFALCVASGYSSLLGMVFPRRVEHYDRYLTLRGVPEQVVDRWKRSLLWFLKKLSLKTDRTIVLKSPPHTARIRLLLELFPGARFVHIYRNPYAVFQSVRHMYDTTAWHTYLQRPDLARLTDDILQRYTTMYDAYWDERDLIPAGQIHEVCYEDLARDPVGQVENIYRALDLPSFEAFSPALQQYVGAREDYRRNSHAALPPELRERVAQAWRRSFERWGYAYD